MYLIPDPKNKPDSTVREVQMMLNTIRTNYHHNWDYISVDGVYGRDTARAVKKFQEYKGISSNMSANGAILGDTTITYIRQEYDRVPQLSSGVLSSTPSSRGSSVMSKSKTVFDAISLMMNEGAPIYKELEKAFPIAFKRLSARSDKPMFVFSKQEAYHKGAKYGRFNLPESVSRYLGIIGLAWSWLAISFDCQDYTNKKKGNNLGKADLAKLGANIFSACTASVDTVLSFPATKQFASKIAGKYAVAQTGAAFSVAGATAVSVAGQCIGAFLLGWEIGDLIGDIPIGNGVCVQDAIDDYIDRIWEHPYKMLGPFNSIAYIIDAWKKIIDWNVNRISNLKPLTPAEKQKLDLYIQQHREMEMYAAPPRYSISAKR